MTTRASLPNRRLCERVTISHGDQKLHVTTGFDGEWRYGVYYAGTKPQETFISVARLVGSDFESSVRDIAVLVSLALQHGAPLETMQKAITRLDDGSPAGAGGRLLDIIAQEGNGG